MNVNVCEVPGCDREAVNRKICDPHRYRIRTYGDPHAGGTIRDMKSEDGICVVAGCSKSAVLRGRCRPHYRGWLLYEAGTVEEQTERQERERSYAQKYKQQIKDQVFSHYGTECSCCKEDCQTFLVIDHVNNDGAEHRRSMNVGGDSIYRWLIKNDFPEGFQTLCHNCNWAKHALGKCPHDG